MSGRTVLRGARWPGDVAIVDGHIVEVGSIAAMAGDLVIDCTDCIVTAGFVNTHHHLYQWMTRGRAVGCDLFGWLTELYPVWGRLDVDDVRAAALVGLSELALSGCTTAFDHHYLVPRGDDRVFDAVVDAARLVGVRLHLSRGSMDVGESLGGLPPDHVVEDRDAVLASTERIIADYHDGERICVVVAPCSPFSVSRELMIESAALARRHGLRLHTHLAETLDEDAHCLERFGARPLDLMDEWGWAASDVWYAHGVHFNDDEVRRLGATGIGVAHCPSSNARLGAGMCRTVDLTAAGAPVGLGVDGAASNEGGHLFPSCASRCTRRGSGPSGPTCSCRPMRSTSRPAVVRAVSDVTTSARSRSGGAPISRCGTRTISPTCPTPSTASCSGPTARCATCSSAANGSLTTGDSWASICAGSGTP